MKPEHLIFRISAVVRAVEHTVGLDQLDMIQKSILVFIGEAEAARRAINVTDIVKTSVYGTGPTVYARMSDLEAAGWIQYIPDPYDRRSRQVILSESARSAYKKISREVKTLFD